MASINDLRHQIEQSDSLKLVTEALGDLAALEIQKTRAEVLQNTQFFNEIAEVYHDVRIVSAKHRLLHKLPPHAPKNGKTVAVLLTSNEGFFGGLDLRITEQFINTTKQFPTERIVVGKFAINRLTSIQYPESYTPILFDRDMPTPEELHNLVGKTIAFSKVLLFHAKFVTTLHQEPEISDISSSEETPESLETKIDYIIEPEMAKMLVFFENQLLALLYKAIFLQSQLSKTAARMVSMYEAELNVEKQISAEKHDLLKAHRQKQNVMILETYAGMQNLLSYRKE